MTGSEVENKKALVVGGPMDNTAEMNGETAEGAADGNSAENNAEAAKSKKWTTASGKEFGTPEELQAYTNGIEESLVRTNLRNASTTPAPAQETAADPFEKLSEDLFTNPKGVLKEVHEMGRRSAQDEIQKKDASQKFWGDFYEKNPDLSNAKRIVDSISREIMAVPENQRLSPDRGAELIAKEVRASLKGVLNQGGAREEVNGDRHPQLSGTVPVGTRTAAPKKPISFIDQVKSFKAKKKA